MLTTKPVSQKWYEDLVTDVLEIRNRAGLAVVRGYWEMGGRILGESEERGLTINELVHMCTKDIDIHDSTLRRACQFAGEYRTGMRFPKI